MALRSGSGLGLAQVGNGRGSTPSSLEAPSTLWSPASYSGEVYYFVYFSACKHILIMNVPPVMKGSPFCLLLLCSAAMCSLCLDPFSHPHSAPFEALFLLKGESLETFPLALVTSLNSTVSVSVYITWLCACEVIYASDKDYACMHACMGLLHAWDFKVQ